MHTRSVLATMVAAALGFANIPAWAEPLKIAITAIVEHPALDAVRKGVLDELKAEGYADDRLSVEFQSAQGNPGTAVQIARQFVGEAPAVIIAISTPSAQAVVAATQDIPVVFSAITDPLGAQLVRDLARPGGNVTGVCDMAPVVEDLGLIREIMPAAGRLGIVYNPGEPNSVTLVEKLKAAAPGHGFTVTEAAAGRSADVQGATQSLVGKVDAVFVPTDNTVVSAFEAVVGVGNDNKLPVFAADIDSVQRGAIASIGFDYHDVGLTTGKIVGRVLKGDKPGDIAVVNATGSTVAINLKAAADMGVVVPAAVLARNPKVFGK